MKLRQGTDLRAIHFSDGGSLIVGGCIKSISVSEEHGQCATVPWAVVTNTDGAVSMYNLALIEGVDLDARDE